MGFLLVGLWTVLYRELYRLINWPVLPAQSTMSGDLRASVNWMMHGKILMMNNRKTETWLLQGWATSGFLFFLLSWKKTWARQVGFFFIGEKMAVWSDTTADLPRISRFFCTNIEVSRFPDSTSENPTFCFVLKLEKQKRISLCRMSHVSKPTKRGLKINCMVGWINGLGWILCTLRLSEWGRLGVAHH